MVVKEVVEDIKYASVDEIKEYNAWIKRVNDLLEALFGKEYVTKYSCYFKELPMDKKMTISEYKEAMFKVITMTEFLYKLVLNQYTKR